VLGFVTAGLTAVSTLMLLATVLGGDRYVFTYVLLLGLPCAAGLLIGATDVVRRRSWTILFGSAVAAIAVLGAALVAGAFELPGDEAVGLAMFMTFALPLPVLTAVFTRLGTVTGRVAARGR
jgi:hypothetical protein